MKATRFSVLVLIGVVVIASLGLFSMRASAGASAPALQDDLDKDGPDTPITGEALDKASAAALDYLGEGRVTDSEVGDEEGFYEIEVTLANGQEVDVHLNENFRVLGKEVD